jgi:hypothetical protein
MQGLKTRATKMQCPENARGVTSTSLIALHLFQMENEMRNRRVILAGGSGFLGRAMTPDLVRAGYEVIVLTRGRDRDSDGIRFVHWGGKALGPWAKLLDGAAGVVNLAGRSVN